MATDTVSPGATAPTPATAPNPAWGIAWGGAMLLVLALWLRAKFDDLSFILLGAVGLLGAAGIAFAAWQLVRSLRQAPTPEQTAQRRTAAGLICMAGGAAMIVLAVALWVALRLAGFGEYVGLFLFGLAALACGKGLLKTSATDPDAPWQKLRGQLGPIKLALVVLGAGGVIAFLSLSFGVKLGAAWFPELAALFIGGLFLAGAAFWLQLQSATGTLPTHRLRLFGLVVGGVVGFIVTVMILCRMFLWRDQVFLGGLTIWLGEGSWRLWLCAYVLLAGLGLMFVSLLLARADIHQSVGLRRGLYGYNTIFNGVLLLAILILANILFFILVPYTINWSRTSFSTLSPSTKNLLLNLKEPTKFYVLMSEGHPATSDLKVLMENARAENGRIEVQFLSPEAEPKKYLDLARRYKVLEPEKSAFGLTAKRGVLVVYGKESDDPNQALPPNVFVADNKIFESKSDEPPGMPPQMRGKGKTTQVFKAEPEIMRELHHLSAGKQKRKLYVLQGNGELDINSQEAVNRVAYNEPLSNLGVGKLVERLKKDEFEVQGLKFTARLKKEENMILAPETGPDKKKEIPEDAYAVVIPGPCEPMTKETLDALERYVDKGGRLLVFFETIFDEKYAKMRTSGLEDFLKKYGVEVRPEYAIQIQSRDPRLVLATTPAKAETVLAKQFGRMQFFTARVVKPLPAGGGRFKAEPLFQLDPRQLDFWPEDSSLPITDIAAYARKFKQNQETFLAKIMQEPLPIAVTVTEGAGDLAKPRMVIFGDTDFIMNEDRQLGAYYDLIASSLEWMAEKGGYIGPRPRETPSYNAPIGVDGTRLFVYPGLLMVLTIVGLGTGLWLVRRR